MKNLNLVTEITLEDNGQDFLQFYVSGNGVILDCQPFQGSAWVNNRIPYFDRLKVGSSVQVITADDMIFLKYKIEGMRLLSEQESKEVYGYYEKWLALINNKQGDKS